MREKSALRGARLYVLFFTVSISEQKQMTMIIRFVSVEEATKAREISVFDQGAFCWIFVCNRCIGIERDGSSL